MAFSDITSAIGLSTNLGIGGKSKSHSKRPYNFAREQMSNQIRWRVQDAKNAGLHPLAALGIAPAGSPPHVVGSAGISGQVSSKLKSPLEVASVEESKARTDLIREQIDASRASRAIQNANTNQDVQYVGTTPRNIGPPRGSGRRPGIVDKPYQAVQLYDADGKPWIVDSGSPGDDLEQEYGEAAIVFQLKKLFKDMQTNDAIPSKRDLQAIRRDVRRHARKKAKARKLRTTNYIHSRHFSPKDVRRTNPYRR